MSADALVSTLTLGLVGNDPNIKSETAPETPKGLSEAELARQSEAQGEQSRRRALFAVLTNPEKAALGQQGGIEKRSVTKSTLG